MVSADSMNVYQGTEYWNSEASLLEQRQVVYHGVDVVKPTEPFHVGLDEAIQPAVEHARWFVEVRFVYKCLKGLDSSTAENKVQRPVPESSPLKVYKLKQNTMFQKAITALTADDPRIQGV